MRDIIQVGNQEINRDYYKKNVLKRKEYYQKNREKILLQRKKYYLKNKDKKRAT